MSAKIENAFTFTSQGLPAETFTVVRFEGEEALSTLYRFDILLVSARGDLDLDAIIESPATLTIKDRFAGDQDLPIHGTLTHVEQLHVVDGHYFYRAELRPRLWWLTQRRYSQIFLDLTLIQCVQQVLQEGGLRPGLDYEFRRTGDVYPSWDYVCQYDETHFNFLSRWLEWGGVYYWFEQGETGETLVITDNLMAHSPLPGSEGLRYAPVSGLETPVSGRVVQSFNLRQCPIVRNIRVKDYNYQKPAIELDAQTVVQGGARGEFYHFSDGFRAMAGADSQARVRSEELQCRQRIFYGQSPAPTLRPGHTFSLSGHFHDPSNQDYLTIRVQHCGSQARLLQSGLGVRGLEDGDALFYRNRFECIPASTQFRPARETPWPRIYGTISAKVDAAGSGKYADLDSQGRYKVIMPFDLSGREDGRASAWIRMATPYAGDGHGMHFPLHKGTEVLLTFVGGNPDRPTILAAVPNPQTASVVTAANHTCNRIQTAAGHQLVMDDLEGKESVGLFSSEGSGGGSGSWLWMGKNSPQSMQLVSSGNTDTLTNGMFNQIVLGSQNNVTLGANMIGTLGISTTINIGAISAANVGGSLAYSKGNALEFGEMKKTVNDSHEILGTNTVTLRGGAAAAVTQGVNSTIANIAVGAAAVMTALSTTSGVLATEAFPNASEDGDSGDPAVGWTAAGIGIAAALAQWAAIVVAMKNLVQTLDQANSAMTLGTTGIELTTTDTAASGIVLKTHTAAGVVGGGKITANDTGVVLEKDDANLVTGGKVAVSTTGVQIEKDAQGALVGGKVAVTATGVVLDQNAAGGLVGGRVTINDQGLLMEKDAGAKISVDADKVTLTAQNNIDSIAVTSTGLKLNFNGGNLQAGPLKIDPAGLILMG